VSGWNFEFVYANRFGEAREDKRPFGCGIGYRQRFRGFSEVKCI
jgi:hypothetical protein